MKKSLLLILLSMTSASLFGCGQADPVDPAKDPTEIVKLEVNGSIKTEYAYEDEWDLSGLSVKGIQRNGTKVALKSTEYTLTPSVKTPKKLISKLSVLAKYSKNQSVTATRVFSDVKVADEVYDEADEISKYYTDCNLTYTGTNLVNELHRHTFVKHTNFVLYSDVSAYIRKLRDYDSTDLIPGEHNTEYYYTGQLSNYNSGTREHVWACNDSSGLWPHGVVDAEGYYGGGSDLYHVRPCDTKVNTARGDAPFVDFDDSEFSSKRSSVVNYPLTKTEDIKYQLKCYQQGYKSGEMEYADLVEPDDAFKGDIARCVAYIYMHYKTNSKTPSKYKSLTGSLLLTSVIGYSTEAKCIEVLKKWNELDAPSPVEKHRNHVVGQIQGNRNPFVDYPDLVNKMFQTK